MQAVPESDLSIEVEADCLLPPVKNRNIFSILLSSMSFYVSR